LILLALCISVLCGCGSGRPATFSVTGTVTYRGQPLEGARVMFIPKNTRPAVGLTDAQGRFTLLSFAPEDGAVLGEHVVCVAKSTPDPNDKSGSPYPKSLSVLPERYATPLKSPLKATVTAEGPNDFRFDLTD
jgi:hypothetical protein